MPSIEHKVKRALTNSGRRALGCLEVGLRDGAVVLSGHVSSYYDKQLAQEIAMRVRDVPAIRNEVVVGRSQ